MKIEHIVRDYVIKF